MNTTWVTETGAPGAGNTSRGDRDGASEGSVSQDHGGIPPRRERRAGSTTPERGVPSDGGGGGKVFPSLPPHGAGGTGGRVFSSLPPQGAGGVDGRAFPSLPREGLGGVGGREFPPPPPQGVEGGAGWAFSPPPPLPSGERDQEVPRLPWGPYDGRARAAGPPRPPPREGGDRAPTGAQDAAAISAALQDSWDALISPFNDRLSLIEIAIGTTRRSRRRRRRMSSYSSDGEYSRGDGGRHVPRRSVTRALETTTGGGKRKTSPPTPHRARE